MLTIPIETTVQKTSTQKNQYLHPQLTWPEEFKWRQTFLQQAQGYCENPERILPNDILKLLGEQETLCADYALCHASTIFRRQNEKKQQQQMQLEQEAQLIIEMGAQAVSARLLAGYLDVQLPHYAQHLHAAGLSKQAVSVRLQQVRAEAAKRCILQALSTGNYALVQQILVQESSLFDADFKQHCVAQIQHQFAYEQAQKLWEDARLRYPENLENAATWGREQIRESDEQLRKQIEKFLETFYQEAQIVLLKKQGCFLRNLANGSPSQVSFDCDLQTTFTPEQLDFLYEVCTRLRLPAKKLNPTEFVKLYFSSTEKENKKAYQNGSISARDYLLLEAVRCERQSGTANYEQILRAKQLKTELSKKGFSADEIARMQYEILSAADCEAAWNFFQHLLNQ